MMLITVYMNMAYCYEMGGKCEEIVVCIEEAYSTVGLHFDDNKSLRNAVARYRELGLNRVGQLNRQFTDRAEKRKELRHVIIYLYQAKFGPIEQIKPTIGEKIVQECLNNFHDKFLKNTPVEGWIKTYKNGLQQKETQKQLGNDPEQESIDHDDNQIKLEQGKSSKHIELTNKAPSSAANQSDEQIPSMCSKAVMKNDQAAAMKEAARVRQEIKQRSAEKRRQRSPLKVQEDKFRGGFASADGALTPSKKDAKASKEAAVFDIRVSSRAKKPELVFFVEKKSIHFDNYNDLDKIKPMIEQDKFANPMIKDMRKTIGDDIKERCRSSLRFRKINEVAVDIKETQNNIIELNRSYANIQKILEAKRIKNIIYDVPDDEVVADVPLDIRFKQFKVDKVQMEQKIRNEIALKRYLEMIESEKSK
jgi:hypothetical protein